MDETIPFDDLLTERMAHRCRRCERPPGTVHLHIRPILGLMLAAAVCRACEREDPTQARLDALLSARYLGAVSSHHAAYGYWGRGGDAPSIA